MQESQPSSEVAANRFALIRTSVELILEIVRCGVSWLLF